MPKKRKKSDTPEVATCHCLLLCQDFVEWKATGRHELHNVVGTLLAREFPAVFGPFVAYIRLSNVYGRQTVNFSFQNADTEERLIEFDAQTHPQANPLGVVTTVVPISPFEIRTPGRYIFVASHAGTPIALSPIDVGAAG
jgi:hypothetical protein